MGDAGLMSSLAGFALTGVLLGEFSLKPQARMGRYSDFLYRLPGIISKIQCRRYADKIDNSFDAVIFNHLLLFCFREFR